MTLLSGRQSKKMPKPKYTFTKVKTLPLCRCGKQAMVDCGKDGMLCWKCYRERGEDANRRNEKPNNMRKRVDK